MANKSLLTYGAKVSAVEQAYYFPSVVLPYATNSNLGTLDPIRPDCCCVCVFSDGKKGGKSQEKGDSL